jgi:hypothetical protein
MGPRQRFPTHIWKNCPGLLNPFPLLVLHHICVLRTCTNLGQSADRYFSWVGVGPTLWSCMFGDVNSNALATGECPCTALVSYHLGVIEPGHHLD